MPVNSKSANSSITSTAKKAEVDATLPNSETRQRNLRAEITRNLPSTAKLATLASILMSGSSPGMNSSTTSGAVKLAFDIWQSSSKLLNEHIEIYVSERVANEEAQAKTSQIPKPDRFPVPFNDFLRLTVGGKYAHDRQSKFRHYLMAIFDPVEWKSRMMDLFEGNEHLLKVPDARDWAGKVIGELKEAGVTERQYNDHAHRFIAWLAEEKAKQASAKASKAAITRHGKKAVEEIK